MKRDVRRCLRAIIKTMMYENVHPKISVYFQPSAQADTRSNLTKY